MQVSKIDAEHDGDGIVLKTINDVHYGDEQCDVKAFKRYLAKSDHNTYFLGLGDYMDMIIPGDPRYFPGMTGGVVDIVDDQLEGFAELLAPYTDRILGLGWGNHEWEVLKRHGTSPASRLSRMLGVRDLGYSGLMNLGLKEREKKSRSRSVIIRYHHGFGGSSRTSGGDLTKFEKECANWDADLFLYGHVHKLQTCRVARGGLCGSTFVAKDQHVVICGTFKKTFNSGPCPTWSEKMGFPMRTVGAPTIYIKPRRYRQDIRVMA